MKKIISGSLLVVASLCVCVMAAPIDSSFVFPLGSMNKLSQDAPLPKQNLCTVPFEKTNFCGAAADSSDGCFATKLSVPGCKIIEGNMAPVFCLWDQIIYQQYKDVSTAPETICEHEKIWCDNNNYSDCLPVFNQCVAEINYFRKTCL